MGEERCHWAFGVNILEIVVRLRQDQNFAVAYHYPEYIGYTGEKVEKLNLEKAEIVLMIALGDWRVVAKVRKCREEVEMMVLKKDFETS